MAIGATYVRGTDVTRFAVQLSLLLLLLLLLWVVLLLFDCCLAHGLVDMVSVVAARHRSV